MDDDREFRSSSMSEEESMAWRKQVLEEAGRLRSALKEAQNRRVHNRGTTTVSGSTSTPMSPEMEMFEEAQAQLKRNTTRLEMLRRQVEAESNNEEAEKAQLAFLDMAELEMERTRQRMKELEIEVSDTTDTISENSTFRTESDISSSRIDNNAEVEEEEEDDSLPPAKPPTALIATPAAEIRPKLNLSAVVEQRDERTVSMDQRDEQTWNKMMTDVPPTPMTTQRAASASVSSDTAEFSKPKVLKKEEVSFDVIRKEMHLSSSPLVFFNLACFHTAAEADIDVMLPICGYAVAGRMLCVMGPAGTNTSILRAALSEAPGGSSSREVNVADFTVADLIDIGDGVLRPEYLAPSVPLIKHLELESVATVQIGTCIQRGASDNDSTTGTPRGSRNPEQPTPRNPQTPRFRGTGAGIQKAVLLMEDLVSVLDAQAIFRVLKILRKVVTAKRATVLVTLSKPFERRGLFSLFDDVLYFTLDGVSYFGPTRRLKDYCGLIGHPCPATTHVTDHIGSITNAAAKFDESPVKAGMDAVVAEFTGKQSKSQKVSSEGGADGKKGIFKRKGGKAKKDEEDDDEPMASARTRKLAHLLAEERRQQAMKQKAWEKLDVWKRLADLDSHIPKSKETASAKLEEHGRVVGFDQMILELQDEAKRHRPSCFMNLACFLNLDNPEKTQAHVIQPTVAFANEGQMLGVMGPSNADSANLLASLKLGSGNTLLTPLTVRDTLKLSEFVKHREQEEKLEHSVELMMGKMMLSACSQEVIGTLIQRGNASVPQQTTVAIGDMTFSTAVRSILILDRILDLEAQSVFVVLKLLKRIAMSARLAIVLMLHSPEAAEGLFYLLDLFLCFTEDGVGYFGPSRHLASYCALVGFPVAEGKHVTAHIRQVMADNPPTLYVPSEANLNTPFTVRYQYSALCRYNKGIIDLATKQPSQDSSGGATSRTLLPRTFRSKKSSRMEDIEAVVEKAETIRQASYQLQLQKLEEAHRIRQRDLQYEEIWKHLADSDSSKKAARQPLKAGLKSIVVEMSEYQSKPSLFFNLACFLPEVSLDRIDTMQPVCGYVLIGRIVGVMGPSETNLAPFLQALSGDSVATRDDEEATPLASARRDVRHRILTVFELLKLAESSRTDRGSQPLHETATALMNNLGLVGCADAQIGTMIQRGVTAAELSLNNLQVPIILMLDHLSDSLDAQAAFVVLKVVKRIASLANLSVILHLPKPAERRGLFSLLDDVIVFDLTGVTYFGPANRLADYLKLVGFSIDAGVHETDACFSLLAKYAEERTQRLITDTPPPVRYKYSPIADYVASVVARYTKPSDRSEYDLQSARGSGDVTAAGSTFVPKNTRNLFRRKAAKLSKEEEVRRLQEEEAAQRRSEIAAREAEAERMRIAEAEAEAVWHRLQDESAEKHVD